MASLQPLQPDSGKRFSSSVITGMTMSITHARNQLMRSVANQQGRGFLTVPAPGQRLMASRCLMTVRAERSGGFTESLNTALLGGEQYPILNFVLGTAAGVVSGGVGFVFSVATTALSLNQTAQRILARGGDELWQVEQIGRAGRDVVHVGAYFLYDPFRNSAFRSGNGWLIHEERTVLTV
jgi:hypothetical protein